MNFTNFTPLALVDAVTGTGGTGAESVPLTRIDLESEAIVAGTGGQLGADQAQAIAGLLDDRPDPETEGARLEAAESVATDLAGDGNSPSALVASYGPLVDALVDRAFEPVADEDAEAVVPALKRQLQVALAEMGAGVDAMAEAGTAGATAGAGDAGGIGVGAVIDAIPYSTFLIDDEHTVVAYNDAVCTQLGISETEALGEDCRESIAAATYSDGRRHNTLADKVVEAPRTADEAYDVDRADDGFAWSDRIVYEDHSRMKNTEGVEQHITFYAMPFFDDEDDLLGVLELVEDWSAEVQRKQAMEELVEDVCTTLERLADGDFSSRVTFEDERGIIDEELLRIVREVNSMIGEFDDLIRRVGEETTALAESIEDAAAAASDIDAQATEQNEALEQAATEMEEFSATMEEVAASANQVSTAADEALAEADDGRQSALAAQSAVDEVTASSEALIETVEQLDAYMAEIETVTDVIAGIAEQTNILALNANIEAARAGEDGQGFGVVANEVKELADETRSHTDEIAEQVARVQEQTEETVAEVRGSHERIQNADERIEATVDSLRSIAATAEDAADGISEVADANDDQAATVEEVLATVEGAAETATTVEEIAEEIVAETDRQQESVSSLSGHVAALVDES